MKHCMLIMYCFALTACAHTLAPLPPQAHVYSRDELFNKLVAVDSPRTLTAQLDTKYQGKQGSLHTTATVAVREPHFFRYELEGPHGGVLFAFATNGKQAFLQDETQNTFEETQATPDAISRMLHLPQLNLSAQEWVMALLGKIDIPAHADVATYPLEHQWVARFTQGNDVKTIRVNADTKCFQSFTLDSIFATSQLTVQQVWPHSCTPQVLRIVMQAHDTHERHVLTLKMIEPEFNLELTDDTFMLTQD